MFSDRYVSDENRDLVTSIEKNNGRDGSEDDEEPSVNDGDQHEPPSYQPQSEGTDYAPGDANSDSSSASIKSEDVSDHIRPAQETSSRKRKSPVEGPDILSLDGDVGFRPKKRPTGSFNRAYLDLLNKDILHASSQCVPLAPYQDDGRVDLPESQIGMTIWSSMEKERFFEALGRLGRDDASGIARRIRTKGEIEVRQYIKLLQDSIAKRQQLDELPPLAHADFPAAAELSHECCQALEEAADNLAARQDHFETTVEQDKHGVHEWLVSRETCKEMKNEAEEDDDSEDTSDIFHLPKWLMLSERFFMNAPSEEGNWQAVNGERPSARLTAFHDFHSLALTLTRRLVAASLYTASSRVRAERGYRSYIEDSVKDKDVHAAAISLGLPTRKPPLMKSIRKLGLHVYEEPPRPRSEEDMDMEPLSDEAIEDALADIGAQAQRSVSRVRWAMERIALSSDESSISSDSPDQSGTDTDAEMSSGSIKPEEAVGEDEEDEDVVAEADEAILYCALDPPQTKRDRQALFRRIKAEREQEAYAEAVDAQAGYQEEKLLWEMLGKQPSTPLTEPGTPASLKRLSSKQSVDAGYLVGKDWRAKTKVVSEWEAQYTL